MEANELGAAIDRLYSNREQRLSLERTIKDLKSDELALRQEILACLEESGLSKASGGLATAGRKITTIPIVTDWDSVYGYIKDHDRFDLVQKRISVLAWRDLHNDGVNVPGTEAVEDIDITLTKASRS